VWIFSDKQKNYETNFFFHNYASQVLLKETPTNYVHVQNTGSSQREYYKLLEKELNKKNNEK